MATCRNHSGRRRALAGQTQQQLAERTVVSRHAIGAIESGATACFVGVALRAATALGCRVEELFEFDGETRHPRDRRP